jgi:molybdate transport system ATP-binding protein
MTGEALDARVVVARHGFVLDAEVAAEPGEVVAVMGPSGAGKSTLLGALAGLVPLREGHVRLGGRVLDAASARRAHVTPAKRGVVLLGQDPRLFPHLTAAENVAFGLLARRVGRAAARAEAEEWLARVGLAGTGDRRPAQLSGGQQQRVAIARALATAPSALLLDEPLTSLDTETAADIRQMIRDQLVATRTTAVVATHDAVDSVSLADRLVVVEAGRVTQAGPVRDVLAAPASRFVAAVSGLNRVVGSVDSGGWRSGELQLDFGRPEVGRLDIGRLDIGRLGIGRVGIGRVDIGRLGPGREGGGVGVGDGQGRDGADRGGGAVPGGDGGVVPGGVGELDRGGEPGGGATLAAVFAPGVVHLERGEEAAAWTAARAEASVPTGARRGEWSARVVRLEQTPAGVRVRTADPEVSVDLPADRAVEAGLAPGVAVRLRVDAGDVRFISA